MKTRPPSLWRTLSLANQWTLRASVRVCLCITPPSSRTPALWLTCQTSGLAPVCHSSPTYSILDRRWYHLWMFHILSHLTFSQIQCRGRAWSLRTAQGTAIPASGLWRNARPPHLLALSPQTGGQWAPSTASRSQRVTATVPACPRTQVNTHTHKYQVLIIFMVPPLWKKGAVWPAYEVIDHSLPVCSH